MNSINYALLPLCMISFAQEPVASSSSKHTAINFLCERRKCKVALSLLIKIMDKVSLIYYGSMVAINIISIVFNFVLLVMFLVYRKEFLINAHNKVLLAMLFSSLFIGITGTTNWLLVVLGADTEVYKLIGMIPMFSFFIASITTLCILTFDQLVAIKYPLRYSAIVTGGRIHAAIAFAFSLALAFFSAQISIHKFEGSNIELEIRGLVFTLVFIIGMLILLVTNCKLYKAIQYQRKILRPLSENKMQERSEENPYGRESRQSPTQDAQRPVRKFKTGKMCILLVVIYIINWLPLVIYRITYIAGRHSAIPSFLRISMVLATFYQIIMPCIYLLKRRDFREKLQNLFSR